MSILALLPSIYNLKVEAAGFAPKTLTSIKLDVGQAANIPVQLSVGGVTAEVNVVASNEAAIEPERTQQSSVISEVLIDNLPINRRNYLDFALLTPGVTDADNINDSSDFRVAQTPQSGLSFGGNNGRGNSIMVDGASADTNSGAARTVVSQEGVQEFQVNRNSYNAEFGGASGGIVNIVSKTGSNDIHGSIFGYFRDEKFDARNAFDFNPGGPVAIRPAAVRRQPGRADIARQYVFLCGLRAIAGGPHDVRKPAQRPEHIYDHRKAGRVLRAVVRLGQPRAGGSGRRAPPQPRDYGCELPRNDRAL